DGEGAGGVGGGAGRVAGEVLGPQARGRRPGGGARQPLRRRGRADGPRADGGGAGPHHRGGGEGRRGEGPPGRGGDRRGGEGGAPRAVGHARAHPRHG